MSITNWFEADHRLSEAALIDLLREAGAVDFELENGVAGLSSTSGMNAFPRGHDGELRIKAEDPRGATFEVGCRCTFYPSTAAYDACDEDLREFLNRVVAQTGAHFVVSFQLEETLFVHSGNGVLRCA